MTYSWAKIYIEVLDDHKMAGLTDRLWRRVVELLLLSRQEDNNGLLPSISSMAWTLRLKREDELLDDLQKLHKLEIVTIDDSGIRFTYKLFEKKFCGRDRNDARYTIWRRDVFNRDDYKCQLCGSGGYIEAHHKMPWAQFEGERFDIDNGITLCRQCHRKQHRHRS